MKILVINHEYPPVGGGGGVFCRDLCEEWVRMGHQVEVVTSRALGQKAREKIGGVELCRVWAGWRRDYSHANIAHLLLFQIAALLTGLRLVLKNRYDLMNTHFAVPGGPIGMVLQRICHCPNILTLHGADIYDPTRKMSGHRWWITRQIIKMVIDRADYTVASTKEIQGKVKTYYKTSRSIKVIPLGFLPSRFLLRPRSVYQETGPLKIVTIGRLVRRKNIPLILTAVKDLGSKVILTVVGDGPEKKFLLGLARKLGLRNRVKFAGFLDERKKIAELKKADLFVSASLHEGFGLVFLEAMQAGLPIVASDAGGQTYFLHDGRHARIFRSGDKKDLVEKIDYFHHSRGEVSSYGKRNQEYVKNFYISRIAGLYISLAS